MEVEGGDCHKYIKLARPLGVDTAKFVLFIHYKRVL